MSRENESQYWSLQGAKERAKEMFSTLAVSIKRAVNANPEGYFEAAGVDGCRDLLLSASAIGSATENHYLSSASPESCVRIYAALGLIKDGGDPSTVPDITPVELLLSQQIILSYQLAALPESPFEITSKHGFDVQATGEVVVTPYVDPTPPDPES